MGLDSQKWDAEIRLTDIYDGHTVLGGRWYSPLRTLLFKLPPGTLLLLIGSATYWFALARNRRFDELLIWISALFLIGVLCTQTGLNWPIRYVLPALPLMFVAAGAGITTLLANRAGRAVLAACLLWNFYEIAHISPHFLSYANLVAGGPAGAQPWLHGSNYDWGQDLAWLRKWYDQHRSERPLAVTYYGAVGPEAVSISQGVLPVSFLNGTQGPQSRDKDADQTFYWAVSSNLLNGVEGYFRLEDGRLVRGALRSPLLKPANATARVGYSIYIFRIALAPSTSGSAPVLSREVLRGCIAGLEDKLWVDAVP